MRHKRHCAPSHRGHLVQRRKISWRKEGARSPDRLSYPSHNVLAKGPAFLEQSIFSDAVPSQAVEEIAAPVRQEWKHLLKAAVPQVAQHEANYQEQIAAQAANGSSARIRFGMYFFAENNSLSVFTNSIVHSDRKAS